MKRQALERRMSRDSETKRLKALATCRKSLKKRSLVCQ
jgi:hypothetical protein